MKNEFRLIEDIKFFFDKNGIEVYENDETKGEFILVLPLCNSCGTPWNLEITQCFLCGAFNPFIKRNKQGIWKSITGASGETAESACINKDCPSNKISEIKEAINKHYEGGVFKRGSIFNTSLENCVKCGDDEYNYMAVPVYVIISKSLDIKELSEELNSDIKSEIGPALIIFRNDQELFYIYIKEGENMISNLQANNKKEDLNWILSKFNL